MSRFQCSFRSRALLIPTTITVTLPFPVFDPVSPDQTLDDIFGSRKKFKTLYLLHGAFEDSSSWSLYSRVEEYADRHGLAVVMPSAGNSPEKFAAGISIFGVLDIVTIMRNPIPPVFDADEYFGGFDRLRGSASDLFAQLQHLKRQGVPVPKLYMACGMEDPLYEINVKFRDFAISHSVDLTYVEGPGAHLWDFCDPCICRALDWLSTIQ